MKWVLALLLAGGASLACVAFDYLIFDAIPRLTGRAEASRQTATGVETAESESDDDRDGAPRR